MHLKFAKTAARIAAAGAVVATIGLGSAQLALAKPAPRVDVPCSAAALSSAITDNTGGETLRLATFCVYKLTAALPDITEDLTIDGNQSTIERSFANGTPDFRIFTVDADVDLVLNHVNLRNGDAGDNDGGAIYNEHGTVTVNGGTFALNANEDGNDGGAIYNDADLRVTGATFIGNSAHDGGDGGAIYNDDVATITRSTFTGNGAHDGGAIFIDHATDVAYSNFIGNGANEGGAIDVGSGSNVLSAINAQDDSATVTGSGFYKNHAENGGGIYTDDVLTLTGSTFSLNRVTEDGGGIYNDDDATVNGTTFYYNIAKSDGGGMYNDDHATVNGTTFGYNIAKSHGGGIYNDDDLVISASRIMRNSANSDGGGIYNDDTVTPANSLWLENRPDNCAGNSVAGCTEGL
jgi:predicted outer membrane repeat protein